MLRNELKPAIRKETERKFIAEFSFVARLRPPSFCCPVLQELKCEAIDHPPYSPDLASPDFNLFGPFKEALKGLRFPDDVKEAVHEWFLIQREPF
jgi:hypothetical protein